VTTLRIPVFIAATLALLLSACAATSPQADARFGQSVRATLLSQVAQPAGVRNDNPVTGIDGRAARAAHESYEKSFGKTVTSAPAPAALVNTR
jgi:type IV pilus biogenesis protein CpaD/CtpE